MHFGNRCLLTASTSETSTQTAIERRPSAATAAAVAHILLGTRDPLTQPVPLLALERFEVDVGDSDVGTRVGQRQCDRATRCPVQRQSPELHDRRAGWDRARLWTVAIRTDRLRNVLHDQLGDQRTLGKHPGGCGPSGRMRETDYGDRGETNAAEGRVAEPRLRGLPVPPRGGRRDRTARTRRTSSSTTTSTTSCAPDAPAIGSGPSATRCWCDSSTSASSTTSNTR